MAGFSGDELEARIDRLERVLERILEHLKERDEAAELESEAEAQAPGEGVPMGAPGIPDWYHPEVPAEPAPPEADIGVPKADLGTSPREEAPVEDDAALDGGEGKSREEAPPAQAARSLSEGLGILIPRGTFLSRLGILLLLLSVAFFFKYSIDQGWLTEWVRLAIGVVLGVVLLALGFKGAGKGEPLGTVLAGGGIATFFITGFVGHQWYELVSYPLAFGFLVLASGLGIFLSLRSGLQVLAMVGLVGALATPLLLTSPTAEVAGLALYVSLIVASISAIYLARAWRALFLMAAVTSWLVLSAAVAGATPPPGTSWWVVEGAIAFCVLAFWLAPLLRAGLRADNPDRWLRPESAYPAELDGDVEEGPRQGSLWWVEGSRESAAGGPWVPWNVHLDVLSLLMPLVGIGLSAWLWELSRLELGWVFLGTALLAQGVGRWLSRSADPEDSASTQTFVALLLSTVGIGLVLTGDVLYLAFIAEAAALFAVGSRKGSRIVMGLGGVVEALVLALLLTRLTTGGTLLEGDISSIFDLVAVGGMAFIGTRLRVGDLRRGFFVGAYLGLLAFTARELLAHPSVLYLAFIVESVATHFWASRKKSELLQGLGFVSLAAVVVFFLNGVASGRTMAEGVFPLLVDLAALAAAVYVGILTLRPQVRGGLFAGAYLGLLALFARELTGYTEILYSVFILSAVLTQVAAARWKSSLFSGLGHLPAALFFVQFLEGLGSDQSLSTGELVSLVDLTALAGTAYIGTLLTGRELRLAYLYAAYLGLLAWTGRELYPLEQGQALMSLAFGIEGTVLLVWGLLTDRALMQKTGMATLLLVVGKILLVDLAAVEPIWRVLLLFLFAVLFLVLSKIVQGRREAGKGAGG